MSNGKDIIQIFGLVQKMTHVYYFPSTFFHTYITIMELVSLETSLNNLSRKNKITQNTGQM